MPSIGRTGGLYGIVALAAIMGSHRECAAQISVYTNAASWRAAVGGPGAINVHEDFGGFTIPTNIITTPVILGGGAIAPTVTATPPYNPQGCMVVVSPVQRSLQLMTILSVPNFSPDQIVTFSFPTPVHGLGFESTLDAGQWSRVLMDVYSGPNLLGTWTMAEGSAQFSGFVTDSMATSLVFRSGTLSSRPPQASFNVDNIEGATVPAPGMLGVAALAGLGAFRRGRVRLIDRK